ncbi:RNA-directed DNA polymerase from mobile element jockey [Lucilia cuprina]|nr:RNA-directed DNA polymerase from mobile element jockey [Lucilia cuprina]
MAEITLKNFKIIHINVNSLIRLSKRNDLYNFITEHKPDCVLLNETKLNTKHKIIFENYEFIRKDRPNSTRGGGTAILLRNDIKYKYCINKTINKFKYLECCVINIPLKSDKTLYISSVYYPSGNNNECFQHELHQLFVYLNLQSLDNYYVIAGDLNSKHKDWGNENNNTKGNLLSEWLSNYDLDFKCKLYASNCPSFPRGNSFIDLCIADARLEMVKENNLTNCLKTIEYDSDHNAIEINVILDVDENLTAFYQCLTEPEYNFKKGNWNKFNKTILRELQNYEPIPNNRNLLNSEIDSHLQKIHECITLSIDKSIPKFKKCDNINKFTNSIIRKLCQEKNKILSIIKKYNRMELHLTTYVLNLLKVKLKLIKKMINDNYIQQVNKHYSEKLSKYSSKNPDKMYREIKKQFNMSQTNIDSIKISQGEEFLLGKAGIVRNELDIEEDVYVVSEKVQILNVIGSYLELVHSKKNIDPGNSLHLEISESFNRFLYSKLEYEDNHLSVTNFDNEKRANQLNFSQTEEFFVTLESLTYIFQKLNNKLSFGVDKIPNIVLKHLPSPIIGEYCTLFNNMLNNSYFPQMWKTAKVVVIPKKDKDPHILKNLRPISLLPNISKVFEVCINNNLLKFYNNQNLQMERQFGFKFKHSTTHAIHLLLSDIYWNWNRSQYTGACLIDFEKAFDNVWISGLFYKLEKYNMPLYFRILIHNMLNDKKFKVTNRDNTSSNTFDIFNGLQQGMVNSPILFNLYLNDLMRELDNIIAFADDIIIYQADDTVEKINRKLQDSFKIVEKYAFDWQMKINVDKCETILFRPPVNKCNSNMKVKWKDFGIKSNRNETIPNKEHVKYLGVTLDKFLYFNKHIDTQLLKAKRAFYTHKRLFYSKYILHKVKIILYQSFIRPILTYGCPIWFNISPTYMEKYRVLERKCIRACLSLYRSPKSNYVKYISNKKLYDSANIIRIDNFIIHLIRNHIKRCCECDTNNLIAAMYYCNEDYITTCLINGYVPPESFPYLDKKGFIINNNYIPIIYHISRRINNKTIYDKHLTEENRRFSTATSPRDKFKFLNVNIKNYWSN